MGPDAQRELREAAWPPCCAVNVAAHSNTPVAGLSFHTLMVWSWPPLNSMPLPAVRAWIRPVWPSNIDCWFVDMFHALTLPKLAGVLTPTKRKPASINMQSTSPPTSTVLMHSPEIQDHTLTVPSWLPEKS